MPDAERDAYWQYANAELDAWLRQHRPPVGGHWPALDWYDYVHRTARQFAVGVGWVPGQRMSEQAHHVIDVVDELAATLWERETMGLEIRVPTDVTS